MFMSSAYAQTAAAGSDLQTQLMGFMPIILIMGVMYFLLFRPQQQRMKELKQAQSAIRRGDRVVTAGGVLGVVARVINDEEVEVEIATGVKVRVVRSTISTVVSKSEPAGKEPKPAELDDASETDDPATPAKKRRSPPSGK
ncbi:MAG: preprotein translocase subunit YajC [Aliidongia sp.]|jgi:preprotein translocase subunit YajC